ncbi:MAG: bifunctional DNA primase/polymerase [Aureliella sp.]
MANSLHDAALRYADLGFAVFPCVPGRKEPLCAGGCNDATCDLDQIDEWWTQRPNANIGIATRGLLVVDIDRGANWLSDEPERALDLGVAPLSLTAGGGQQYFFRQPAGQELRNTTGKLAKHVDTRADGGYVVAPPSVLQGSRRYRWADGMELESGPESLPEPPAWLLDQLEDHAATSPTVAQSPTSTNTIPSGQRNATLARLAGTMRRAGMSQTEIVAAIRETNRLRCRPSVDEAEVLQIAGSVSRYEPDQITVALIENHWEQLKAGPPEVKFDTITSAELDDGEYELTYLVNGVLVRGQPGVIAGPKKTLKTNISVDLALSLAEADPFLGRFDVPIASRVGIMSGESGAATLQETARRVAKAKGLKLRDCSNVFWCFDVPQLGQHDHVEALGNLIADHELDVLILDPTYLMMLGLGNDAGNLFIVGGLLKSLGELAQRTGCTPLLCHHLKKSVAEPYEPAELENIAWAGFQEFVRQWILLNRRVKYDPDQGGHHELWMSVGGSAGHSGLWGVDVDEGVRDDPGGRRWDLRTLEANEAYEARDASEEQTNERRKESRAERKYQKERSALLTALTEFPCGETSRVIRESAGVSGGRFKDLIGDLIDDGMAENCEVTKANGQKYDGFKLTGTDLSH